MRTLWLDANVVLRLFTRVPEAMAKKSLELMQKAEQGKLVLKLSPIITAQIIWVLKSYYKRNWEEISAILIPFLSSDGLEVEERDLLTHALQLTRDKNVEFVDAYLALKAAGSNEEVCSFEETDFKKLPARWAAPPA